MTSKHGCTKTRCLCPVLKAGDSILQMLTNPCQCARTCVWGNHECRDSRSQCGVLAVMIWTLGCQCRWSPCYLICNVLLIKSFSYREICSSFCNKVSCLCICMVPCGPVMLLNIGQEGLSQQRMNLDLVQFVSHIVKRPPYLMTRQTGPLARSTD